MGWVGAFRIAASELTRHPWRTILAAQGLIWAVALMIVPAAILEGSRKNAEAKAAELGVNRLEVFPDADHRLNEMLQESDLSPLAEGLGPRVAIAPMRVARVEVSGAAADAFLLGTTQNFGEARAVTLRAGGFPSWEGAAGKPASTIEVIVEEELAAKLFPGRDPIGARLILRRGENGKGFRLEVARDDAAPPSAAPASATGDPIELRVVGITQSGAARRIDILGIEGDELLSETMRDLFKLAGLASERPPWLEDGLGIYVPYQLLPGDRFQWLFLSAEPHEVGHVADRAQEILTQRGRRLLVGSNAIWQVLLRPELENYLALHRVLFTGFFIVGFLMMANLILLAGWRRRGEIALRRVEGATRWDVFRQFLGEGLLLAFVGLLIGVPLGLALASLRVWLDPNVALAVTPPYGQIGAAALILATGAAAISSYPAWRATRHPPLLLFRKGGSP